MSEEFRQGCMKMVINRHWNVSEQWFNIHSMAHKCWLINEHMNMKCDTKIVYSSIKRIPLTQNFCSVKKAAFWNNWYAQHAVIHDTLHAHVLTNSIFVCEFETKFVEFICRIFCPVEEDSSFLQNTVKDPKYTASYSKVHRSIH